MKVLIGTTKNGIKVFAEDEPYKHALPYATVNIDHVSEAIEKVVYDGQFYIGAVDLGKIVGKETSYITIGICRDDNNLPTLFTAFYGILAPKFMSMFLMAQMDRIVVGVTKKEEI